MVYLKTDRSKLLRVVPAQNDIDRGHLRLGVLTLIQLGHIGPLTTFSYTLSGNTLLLTVFEDTGYPHDGRADKDSYPHDRRADKDSYPHDRRADKDSYPHDRHKQCIMLSL